MHPTSVSGLHVRGLRVRLGDRDIVPDLDLDVPAGELVAVLGANGCGKSTTLRAAVGLAPLAAGEVRVDGVRVRGVGQDGGDRASRRRVAMIFQQVALVPRRTALDNVCAGALGRLPLRRSLAPALFGRDLRAEAMLCLEAVGLADRALDRAGRLSGGQQQRVAVARALCQRASVILADEPTSALDPAASTQVMELLADLAHDRGLAVVAVLHDPDLARAHADRVVGMAAGRIVLDAPAGRVPDSRVAALYDGGAEAPPGDSPAPPPRPLALSAPLPATGGPR
jgi:phosphonate transport system ATP-binding protein